MLQAVQPAASPPLSKPVSVNASTAFGGGVGDGVGVGVTGVTVGWMIVTPESGLLFCELLPLKLHAVTARMPSANAPIRRITGLATSERIDDLKRYLTRWGEIERVGRVLSRREIPVAVLAERTIVVVIEDVAYGGRKP
jgi:hypothetical protein